MLRLPALCLKPDCLFSIRNFTVVSLLSLLLVVSISTHAQSPDIDAALSFLAASQSSDGSWSSSDLRAPSVSTARAAEALIRWNSGGSHGFDQSVNRAYQWLANADSGEVEIRADRVRLAALLSGSSPSDEFITLLESLLDLQNQDNGTTLPSGPSLTFNPGGFGFQAGYLHDAWDSTVALRALLTENPLRGVPSNFMNDPVLALTAYLLETEKITISPTQAGWPAQNVERNPESDVRSADPLVTALVIEALSSIPESRRNVNFQPPYNFGIQIDSAIAQGIDYLGSLRHSQGLTEYYQWNDYTDLKHRILLSAVVLRALIASEHLVTIGPVEQFLVTNQSANGSWLDDPYLTAEVLLALEMSKPNLKITGTTTAPMVIAAGQRLCLSLPAVQWKIVNSGSESSNATEIQCLLINAFERIVLDSEYIPAMNPAQEMEVPALSGVVSTLGVFDLVIWIDPDDYVSEIDEQDNSKVVCSVTVQSPPELSVHDVIASIATPTPLPVEPLEVFEAQAFYITFDVTNSGQATANNTFIGFTAIPEDGGDPIRLRFDSVSIDGTPVPDVHTAFMLSDNIPNGDTHFLVGTHIDPCFYLDDQAPESSHLPPGLYRIEVSLQEFIDSNPDDNSASFSPLTVLPSLDFQFSPFDPVDPDPSALMNCEGTLIGRDSTGIYQIAAGEQFIVWPIWVKTTMLPDSPPVHVSDVGIGLSWAHSGSSEYHGFSQYYYWGNLDILSGGNWTCWPPDRPWNAMHWMPQEIFPSPCSLSDTRKILLDTSTANDGEPLEPGLYTLRLTLDPNNDYDENFMIGSENAEANNINDNIQFRILGYPDLQVVLRDDATGEELTKFEIKDDHLHHYYSGFLTIKNTGEQPIVIPGSSASALFNITLGNDPDTILLLNFQPPPSSQDSVIAPGQMIRVPLADAFNLGNIKPDLDQVITVTLDPGNAWTEGEGEANNIIEFPLYLPDFIVQAVEITALPGQNQNDMVEAVITNDSPFSYVGSKSLAVEFVQFNPNSEIPSWDDVTVLDTQIRSGDNIPLANQTIKVRMDSSRIPCGESLIQARVNPNAAIVESNPRNNNSPENNTPAHRTGPDCTIDFMTSSGWIGFPHHPDGIISAGEHIALNGKVACDQLDHTNRCRLDPQFSSWKDIVVRFYHTDYAPEHLIREFCHNMMGEAGLCPSKGWNYASSISCCFTADEFDWNPAEQGLVGEIPILYEVDPGNVIPESNEENNRAQFPRILNVRYIDLSVTPSDITVSRAFPIQGQAFDIDIRTRNLGSQELGFHINAEIRIDVRDASGTMVPGFPQTTTHHFTPNELHQIQLEANWPEGQYSMVVSIDPDNVIREYGGGDENNIAVKPITVHPPVNLYASSLNLSQPDYGVDCNKSSNGCTVYVGRPITLDAAFGNQGITEVTDVAVSMYLSNGSADFPNMTQRIDRVGAGETLSINTFSEWIPSDDMQAELVFGVDPDLSIQETNELDNEISIDLNIVTPQKPDLTMSALTISGNPIPGIIREGDTVQISARLCNKGIVDIEPGSSFGITCYFAKDVSPEEFWNTLINTPQSLTQISETRTYTDGIEVGDAGCQNTAFTWTITDVRGPGILYVMADSNISTSNPNGDIDEIWESAWPAPNGCNFAYEPITIHADQHHFDTAREGGVEWLLDHQHERQIGESGKLKASYYNLDPDQYDDGPPTPDSFGHYILLDGDPSTPSVDPVFTRIEDESQIGIFDDLDEIPQITTDYFAVVYEGYLNIETTTEFGLRFIVDTNGSGFISRGRGWIWLNNRIMSPYDLQSNIPPMNDLPLDNYKFQSVFVRYNRGDLADLEPGVDCDFKFQIGLNSSISICDSSYQYKLADGPYSYGLWDDQYNQIKQGMLGVLFATAWMEYRNQADVDAYLPMSQEDYLALVEYILNQQNETGSWDEESSFWATGSNLWALALARNVLPDFPINPIKCTALVTRMGTLTLPGQQEQTGAIDKALDFLTNTIYQIPGYTGTQTWPDAGIFHELSTTSLILRALAAIDPEPSNWDSYIPSYVSNNETNLVESILHMFYLSYTGDSSQMYWGTFPGELRNMGISWSPITPLLEFHDPNPSHPINLVAGISYISDLLDNSLHGTQPTLHWHLHDVAFVLEAWARYTDYPNTWSNRSNLCRFLDNLISRALPYGPWNASGGGFYMGSGFEIYDCEPVDSSIRLNPESDDMFFCVHPLALINIKKYISQWPADDMSHPRPNNYPSLTLLDNTIRRLNNDIRSHIAPLTMGVPMKANASESWDKSAKTMLALDVVRDRCPDSDLVPRIDAALDQAYYSSGLYGGIEFMPLDVNIGRSTRDADPMARMVWALSSGADCLGLSAEALRNRLADDLFLYKNSDGGVGTWLPCSDGEVVSRDYETSLMLIALLQAGYDWDDDGILQTLDLLRNDFWGKTPSNYNFNTSQSMFAQIISTLPGADTAPIDDMETIYSESREHLLAMHQHAFDGGWSYNAYPPNDFYLSSTVDATAMSLIALTHNHTGGYTLEEKIAISEGVNWLLLAQIKNEDPLYGDEYNGWGANLSSKTANTNDTALAVWALHAVDWHDEIEMTAYINGCDPEPPMQYWTFHPGETVPVDIYLDRYLDLRVPGNELTYRVVPTNSTTTEPLIEFAFDASYPSSNLFCHSFTIPLGTIPGHYSLTAIAFHGDEVGSDMNAFDIRIEPGARPDLVGRDLAGTSHILEGDPAHIEITVLNQGNAQANASTAMLYLNDPDNWMEPGRALQSFDVPMLPINRSAPLSYDWTPDLHPGTYPLYLVIDNGHSVAESDETNNKYRFDLTIEAQSIAWLGAGPDPFSPAISPGSFDTTGFYFELTSHSTVQAVITRTLPGGVTRPVRTIDGGCLSAGLNVIPWDGCDDSGVPVQASDLYSVELICEETGLSDSGTVEVDNIAPDVEISDFAAPWCLAGVVPVNGTATDRNYLGLSANFVDFTLQQDKGVHSFLETICTQNLPVSDGLLCNWDTTHINADGYVLYLKARDSAGNESTTTRSVSVVEPPPCPGLTSHGPGSTITTPKRSITVTGHSTEKRIRIYINNDPTEYRIRDPFSIPIELNDCTHAIRVTAVDGCGNESVDCEGFTVIVDEEALIQHFSEVILSPMMFARGTTRVEDQRSSGLWLTSRLVWTIRDASGRILNQAPDGSLTDALELTPWIDDTSPGIESAEWSWERDAEAVSGDVCHTTLDATGWGIESHSLKNAHPRLDIAKGQSLIQYVKLDRTMPPDGIAVILSTDQSNNIGLFWGDDDITGLPSGSLRVGDLPAAGDWTRLEIDETALGLDGQAIEGMTFITQNGQAFWDRTTVGFHEMRFSISPKETLDFDYEWFTARLTEGGYVIQAELTTDSRLCDTEKTPLKIRLSEGLECAVITNDAVYAEDDTVHVTSEVHNSGQNSCQDDLDVELVLTHPSGDMETLLSFSIDSMAPDALETRTLTWQTENYPQGQYMLDQVVSRNEVTLTTCSTAFDIYWNPAGYLYTICSVDPEWVESGEFIDLEYEITSQYPTTISDIALWFEVFDSETYANVAQTSPENVSIDPGETIVGSHPLDTTSLNPGHYAVFLMYEHEGYVTTLCLDWFDIIETPTPTPTLTPTMTPTETATPTDTPTLIPTETPTFTPTDTPTLIPTDTPTETPTFTPTMTPTDTATPTPTFTPTPVPTATPTFTPTNTPTLVPTDTPTETPTDTPTFTPTETPTFTCSPTPTFTPTMTPTDTATPTPTFTPTPVPTATPTFTPTNTPTLVPTDTPTETPTDTPTFTPTETPTFTFTPTPTFTPTMTPTDTASPTPTFTSTPVPTATPTFTPTPLPPFTSTPAPTSTSTPNDIICIDIRREVLGDIFDAYIWENNLTNGGYSTTLYTGIVGGNEKRTLIGFELPEGLGEIDIVSAEFEIQNTHASGAEVSIFAISESWDEHLVTWSSFDNAYAPDLISAIEIGSTGSVVFDLTELFIEWDEGTRDNHGIIMISDSSDYETYRSSESSQELQRPVLHLCYRPLPSPSPLPTFTSTPIVISTSTPIPTPIATSTTIPIPTPTPMINPSPTPDDAICIDIRRGATGNIRDAYIWESYSTNGGTSTTLYTGVISGHEKRTLIGFEFPALGSIEVVSAIFEIKMTQSTGDTVSVHAVTEPWSESGVNWASFNNAFDPAAVTSVSSGTVGWIQFDISNLVSDWFSGVHANHGIVMISDSTEYETWRSSEYSTLNYRPVLHLCYRLLPSPSPSPIPTSTSTPTPTPTPTSTFTSTPSPLPSLTPTNTPNLGNPSLEFNPDEWESDASGLICSPSGDLCNTGDPGGDIASNVRFWWEETSAGWIDSIQFSGDFTMIPGGVCRDLTLAVQMDPSWSSAPLNTEAKTWLYAEPLNRPGHITHVRLTITKSAVSR